MSGPVVHFEIHANDRTALAAFYEKVFGWKTWSMEGMPYTLISPTAEKEPMNPPKDGIGGGMMDRQGPVPEMGAPVNGWVCVIQVEDWQATYDGIKAHGGTIAVEPTDVEGVGKTFYFHDPSGNIVGVMQPAQA